MIQTTLFLSVTQSQPLLQQNISDQSFQLNLVPFSVLGNVKSK